MLHRLVKRARITPHLFDPRDHDRTHRLMRVVDRINHDTGRGASCTAAAAPFELTPGRTVACKGRCEKRSPRYTTRWEEFPSVRAI